MAGLFVFTVASLGCGLATSEGFLIAMRFLQGLGAAIVLPASCSATPARAAIDTGTKANAVPTPMIKK